MNLYVIFPLEICIPWKVGLVEQPTDWVVVVGSNPTGG
jgi:hypothetical protein